MSVIRKSASNEGKAPASRAETMDVPAEFTARMFPDVPYENVNVELDVPNWDQGELGDYLEIGALKEVLFLNADAEFATKKLIVGDRIIKINDKANLPKEEITALFHVVGKVSVVVYRRRGFSPVPVARLHALNIVPSYGFTYALLTVTRPLNEPLKGSSMGFVGRVINNKVVLSKIAAHTHAVQWMAVGDALLDLNGLAVPFNQQEFVYQYWNHYKENGAFSTVVERPCSPEALDTINALIASLFPLVYDQVHMTPEAASIGANAARLHKTEWQVRQPESILRRPGQSPAVTPTTSMRTCRTRSTADGNSLAPKTTRRVRSSEANNTKPAPTVVVMNKFQPIRPAPPAGNILVRIRASYSKTKMDNSKRTVVNKTTPEPTGAIKWTNNTVYEIGSEVPDGRKLKKVDKKVKGKGKSILAIFDLF